MRYILISIIVSLFFVSIISGFMFIKESDFPDSQYPQYTYETFAKLPAANKEVELENIDYDLLNAAIFFASNKQRVLHHKQPFLFYPLLRDAAVTQTTQMVKYNFFDHVNLKNPKLKTLKDRLESVGGAGKYMAAGENISEYFLLNYHPKDYYRVEQINNKRIYFNSKTNKPIKPHTYHSFGEAIVEDWMTSPGHRANILNDKFTHLGCGTLYSTKPGEFPKAKATQVFGKLFEEEK